MPLLQFHSRALLFELINEEGTPISLSERESILSDVIDEVFGLGPVSFLRHKRLCAAHSMLHQSAPGSTTVAAVAMGQGFYELGRFAQYYLAMFGERPSQTLGVATLHTEADGSGSA